jgi:hypothetical protein
MILGLFGLSIASGAMMINGNSPVAWLLASIHLIYQHIFIIFCWSMIMNSYL